MQGEKKQGAGSKGAWGKIGDELVKDVPHFEEDDEDIDSTQSAFTLEVKKKLKANKLVADELEPSALSEKSKYPGWKWLAQLRKPDLQGYLKTYEKVYLDSRTLVEFAYHSSTLRSLPPFRVRPAAFRLYGSARNTVSHRRRQAHDSGGTGEE